jgi:hypothetical protein
VSGPSFIATGFAFTTLAGVTDVQTIINAISTMLTATLSATPTGVYPSGEQWTSLGGGAFQAPTDVSGRFMKVTVVRTTIVRMEFKIEDPTGVLLDGEIDIAAGGSTVNIYGGPGHLLVEANNAGTWETARAIMTDPTPEPLSASTVFVWCATHRNAAGGGAIGNAANADYWSGRYYGGTLAGVTFANLLARMRMPAQDNGSTHFRTQAGSDCAGPQYISVDSAANTDDNRNAGKLYQCVSVDSNQVAGTDLNIPIDTGVTGTFRVLHLGPNGMTQFAIRKG